MALAGRRGAAAAHSATRSGVREVLHEPSAEGRPCHCTSLPPVSGCVLARGRVTAASGRGVLPARRQSPQLSGAQLLLSPNPHLLVTLLEGRAHCTPGPCPTPPSNCAPAAPSAGVSTPAKVFIWVASLLVDPTSLRAATARPGRSTGTQAETPWLSLGRAGGSGLVIRPWSRHGPCGVRRQSGAPRRSAGPPRRGEFKLGPVQTAAGTAGAAALLDEKRKVRRRTNFKPTKFESIQTSMRMGLCRIRSYPLDRVLRLTGRVRSIPGPAALRTAEPEGRRYPGSSARHWQT